MRTPLLKNSKGDIPNVLKISFGKKLQLKTLLLKFSKDGVLNGLEAVFLTF